jgi:hypothetical protein
MTGACHHTQLFSLRKGLENFLLGLAWNQDLSDLSLLNAS